MIALVPLVLAFTVNGQPPAPPPPDEDEVILGAPAAIEPAAEPVETIRVEAHSPLRQLPDPRAPVLDMVDAGVELPLVERRGAWARVRYGMVTGWVRTEGPEAEPVAESLAPASPALLARPADPGRLARAVEILGLAGEPARLGPWPLYTDVGKDRVLARLAAVAEQLAAAYRQRYGLAPGPDPGEAVVLFAREAAYRTYEEQEGALSGLAVAGHAGRGIAALFVERRGFEELAGLLVHELVHLLNRRALGPSLPSWLEEGLAEDLAFSEVDRSGRLKLGTLRGLATLSERRERGLDGRLRTVFTLQVTGARSALKTLLDGRAQGKAPDLRTLVDLPAHQFLASERRLLHYTLSAMLVRYLLAGDDGRLAQAFRAFLAARAAGGPDDGRALLAALGTTWPDLEGGFARWLDAEAARLGM